MSVLREYLYVDLEKVKGLASQLYEGLPESSEESRKSGRTAQLGSKAFGLVGGERISDVTDRKIITDSLFPWIERDLEAEGYLNDISTFLSDVESFTAGMIKQKYPPGSLVRITSDARLMDPGYFAKTMAAFSTAVVGFAEIMPTSSGENTSRNNPKARNAKPSQRQSNGSGHPEDLIPDIPRNSLLGPDVTSSDFRAWVKILRGIYPEGLTMTLSPCGTEGPGIPIRLQEGRQHLDADSETLFARYGLGIQEWTVVGTVGYYPGRGEAAVDTTKFALSGDLASTEGGMNRGMITAFINQFLESMGSYGLVEMPQYPGFSIVPLAVYRLIPKNAENLETARPAP